MSDITPQVAREMRDVLSAIQVGIMARTDLSEKTIYALVEMVSQIGFRAVDDMEGVVR